MNAHAAQTVLLQCVDTGILMYSDDTLMRVTTSTHSARNLVLSARCLVSALDHRIATSNLLCKFEPTPLYPARMMNKKKNSAILTISLHSFASEVAC